MFGYYLLLIVTATVVKASLPEQFQLKSKMRNSTECVISDKLLLAFLFTASYNKSE